MHHAGENPRPSNVMYTPRTPQMRQRQRFNLSTMPVNEENVMGLEGLIRKTWNIYAVSALFDFQQDDIYLKLYAKKLREEIASTLSRENVTYDAKFSIMEDVVPTPNHENHPAIKIEVLAKISDQEKEREKSLYQGILLSWRITTEAEPNIENQIRLPLLLCSGTNTCIAAVHDTISRMFDCLIIALSTKEYDLSWLVPIIIMTNKEEPVVSGEVKMMYTVQLPVTDTITVKFQSADLRKILLAIITNQDNDDNIILDRSHIELFFEVLHKQMLMCGGLELGLCTLHRIDLPGITITENKMKLVNIEIMNNVLSYLNEKALDIFHTVHIDI
ncbi:centromere protein L-like [Nylanderia fulva]|uniref:centromere protein L-like n=1 Tax=Nylanderia fulva TaxID=613905 RepID=UPI0010FB7431|nr:centromere protein L-like [Nylanderia fulva]